MEHGDDVREVVLAEGVLGAEAAQCRRQEAPPEAVDGGVDLLDLALVLVGEGVLDDAADARVLVAHDPVVTAGLFEAGGEDISAGLGTLCKRCEAYNEPGVPRCTTCGYKLSPEPAEKDAAASTTMNSLFIEGPRLGMASSFGLVRQDGRE